MRQLAERHRLPSAMSAWSIRPKRQRKAAGPSIQLDRIDRSPIGRPLHSLRNTSGERENSMEMPAILRGDSLTRLLQGAAAGAVVTLVVGFNWGGWVTGGTAKDMVQRSSTTAVVAALSPI